MKSEKDQSESNSPQFIGCIEIVSEFALRRGLLTHSVSGSAHAHMERALAHIREAYVAISEARAVRSVAQLVDDLNRVEQACNELRQQPPSGITVKSFRP
jgi:hypothetical protein